MKKNGLTSMADDFQFEVGARYENMKGVYEVLSIERESMVIRWDDGNEASTSVDLQKRIIERMAHEKELQQLQAAKEREKAQKKGKRKNL